MKINVGNTDRWVRIIAGLGLIGASLTGFIGMWGWLGIVPVLTGTFRFCPAYLPFGLSTCSIKK
ncbi:YgaP family membrane protein [Undibacterium sp. Rencai35W]|uniref:YgaP family membrane protein n=1 Tax=Undibacterium sp. Rencai35W TaxID=3413046 RepID=UPI003BF12348